MKTRMKDKEAIRCLLETGRDRAVTVLRRCVHRLGFKASAEAGRGRTATDKRRGYPQVWSRDSMIAALGALLCGDRDLVSSVRASVDTLRRHRSELGSIPNNVDTKTGRVNFRAYSDGSAWFVIGVANLWEATDSESVLRQNWRAVKDVLTWYDYQDVDRTGLVAIQESTDWQDLFAIRGKGLYVNLLYGTALQKAAQMAAAMKEKEAARRYAQRSRDVFRLINAKFWYDPSRNTGRSRFWILSSTIHRARADAYFRRHGKTMVIPKKTILRNDSYYLPYLTYARFGEWFDSFGNMLAILTGAADRRRAGLILDTVKKRGIARPYPVKATYPPQRPGDPDWRDYYRRLNLNLPDSYHNGGIWPFLGGFYVAALVKAGRHDQAQKELVNLAESNAIGKFKDWEFNEWLHGRKGDARGMADQAWSAGMFLYAYEAVRRKKAPFFG